MDWELVWLVVLWIVACIGCYAKGRRDGYARAWRIMEVFNGRPPLLLLSSSERPGHE